MLGPFATASRCYIAIHQVSLLSHASCSYSAGGVLPDDVQSATLLTTFRQNRKLIYFDNHAQTLFFSCITIVVLEVTLLRPLSIVSILILLIITFK